MLHNQPLLVSVLGLPNALDCTNAEELESVLRNAYEKDDVFCAQFLQGIILLAHGECKKELAKNARRLLSNRGNVWVDIRPQPEPTLLPGTYMIENTLLRRVHRLYDDEQKVFMTTLKPKSLRG